MKTALVMLRNRGSSFGDLVIHCPFFFGLRQLGAERIVAIYSDAFVNILQPMHLIDQIYVINHKKTADVLEIMEREKPTWVITLRATSFRSTLLAWRCKGALRIGWSSFANRLLLHKTVAQKQDVYWPFILERILMLLGGVIDMKAYINYIVSLNTQQDEWVTGQRFVFMPNGSYDAKQWGVPNFLKLGDMLHEQYPLAKRIAVLGPREEPLREEFEKKGWHVLVKPSLVYLTAICAGASCVVANDSGPSHIAQMSNAPMVIMYPHLPSKDSQRMNHIFKVFYWKRPQSFAVCPKHHEPITNIPCEFIFSHVQKAMQPSVDSNEIVYWESNSSR